MKAKAMIIILAAILFAAIAIMPVSATGTVSLTTKPSSVVTDNPLYNYGMSWSYTFQEPTGSIVYQKENFVNFYVTGPACKTFSADVTYFYDPAPNDGKMLAVKKTVYVAGKGKVSAGIGLGSINSTYVGSPVNPISPPGLYTFKTWISNVVIN